MIVNHSGGSGLTIGESARVAARATPVGTARDRPATSGSGGAPLEQLVAGQSERVLPLLRSRLEVQLLVLQHRRLLRDSTWHDGLAYGRYKHIFSTNKVDKAVNRIHVLDTKAAQVRAYEELVVAIGTAGAPLKARGIPVVEVESLLAAALYVRGARPAVLRVSLADPVRVLRRPSRPRRSADAARRVTGAQPPRIDLHRHVWPTEFVAALSARRTPPLLDADRLVTAEGAFPIERDAYSADRCLADLDAHAIDLAVVSLQPTLGVDRLQAREASGLHALWGAGVQDLIVRSRGRLAAFSAGWVQDGFAGLCVSAETLHDRDRIARIANSLSERGQALFVHPGPGARRGQRPCVVGARRRLHGANAGGICGLARLRRPALAVAACRLRDPCRRGAVPS